MASTVLNGLSNPSYTNNTGQNVRLIINYMKSSLQSGNTLNNQAIVVSIAGYSETLFSDSSFASQGYVTLAFIVGKNIVERTAGAGNNIYTEASSTNPNYPKGGSFPVDFMLASGQSFSAICGPHNIVIIPEAG